MLRYTCPICGRSIEALSREDAPHRPFCSRRCQRIDLGRWLDGTYCVSEPLDPEDLEELTKPTAEAENGGNDAR